MTEMTDTQKDVIEALRSSYERYNVLVTRIIEVVDFEYATQYELKRAILTTISEAMKGKVS